MEHECDVKPIINGVNKGSGGPGNKRASGNHPNNSIVEISQNTKKSPRHLRRLAVTQTSAKENQLTLMFKNF